MTGEENASLARRVYEMFNEGHLDQALALASTEMRVELVPFGSVFEGPEGFLGFMKSFKDAFPDIRITVTNQVASEDEVANECAWTGTHTGPLTTPSGEIPPTGKPVRDARFCEVWRIEDGKVVRLVNYQDVSSWLRQLGLAE